MLDFNDLEKKEVGFVYLLRKCCAKLEESWYCSYFLGVDQCTTLTWLNPTSTVWLEFLVLVPVLWHRGGLVSKGKILSALARNGTCMMN